MIHSLFTLWNSAAPAVVTHLLESTMVAIAAGLLTLAFRKQSARARYWLWLAASLKFLVPFSMLEAIGRSMPWPTSDCRCHAGSLVLRYRRHHAILRPICVPGRAARCSGHIPNLAQCGSPSSGVMVPGLPWSLAPLGRSVAPNLRGHQLRREAVRRP